MEIGDEMRAQDYLESLRAGHRHFSYLIEIAEMPYRMFAGEGDHPVARKRALPLHIHEEVEKVIAKHGQSLTVKQREAIWKGVERMEAGKASDLEWPRMIHDQFLASVSDEGRKILGERDLAVGLVQDARFRGSLLKVPGSDNGWVIALYEGYSTIIYSFARTLASTFIMSPSDGGEKTPATVTPDDAAISLFDLLRHQVFVGVPVQKREPITHPHGILAFKLVDMAEKFVYSHEIAHILLNHDVKSERHDLAVAFEDGSEIAPSVQEETDADLLGWTLLIRVFLPEDGEISIGDLQMAYAGTRLFLRVLNLLERARNVSLSGSHPPTVDRLECIRIAGESAAEESHVPFETLKAIDDAMQDAMARVEQALPAPPWRSPVDELFEEAMAVTSKHGFFSPAAIDIKASVVRKILWMLSFNAPRKLCRELGYKMGKAMLELEALGIDVTVEEPPDAPPFEQEALKAALPSFTVFWVIMALECAYLPDEISRLIERQRDRYMKEHRHAA